MTIESTAAAVWYAARPDGSARGPLTRAELLALRARGEFDDDTLVWSLDLSEWLPLKRYLGPPATTPGTGATMVSKPQWTLAGSTAAAPSAAAPAERPAARRPTPIPLAAIPVVPGVPPPATRAPAALSAFQALRNHGPDASAAPPATAAGVRLLTGVRRFLARAFDLAVLGGLGYALLHLTCWQVAGRLLSSTAELWQGWTVVALVPLGLLLLPLEMLWTATSLPTPGKLLFGLAIRRGRSARHSGLAIALRRPALVLTRGQALLIPVLSLLTAAVALRTLVVRGFTEWDEQLGTTVAATPLLAQRWLLGLFALAAAWSVMLGDGWHQLLRPLY